MSLQLIVRFAGLDDTAFRADSENRSDAGLTQLQIWTEEQGVTWILFGVSDRNRAQVWLDKTGALGHAPAEHHFLETS